MENSISNIPGFYKYTLNQRRELIVSKTNLSISNRKILFNDNPTDLNLLDQISENVIGKYSLPYSVAMNFKINNKDYFIPMVTEEPSVVAAASHGAKLARKHGGFVCGSVQSIMTGQIQIVLSNSSNLDQLNTYFTKNKPRLLKIANETDPLLKKIGGGAIDLRWIPINSKIHNFLVLYLDVNVKDAMGANSVNTMLEKIAEFISTELTEKILLRIISNLSTKRLAKAMAVFDAELLGGAEIIDNIILAYELAKNDPFRATTHNKGIMNGISAFALATGNDTRAIEAGAHAYASYKNDFNKYGPLSHFFIDAQGHLVGQIELPLPMALVGGITQNHPMVKISHGIMGVKSAESLSQIAAAVGLAQNIAALRALVTEGIQKGHMRLHNRKIK